MTDHAKKRFLKGFSITYKNQRRCFGKGQIERYWFGLRAVVGKCKRRNQKRKSTPPCDQ